MPRELLAHRAVDLRDARLADAEHVAGLLQVQVLHVEQDEHLLLARGELRERLAQQALGVGEHHRAVGLRAQILRRELLDVLGALLVVADDAVERADVAAHQVVAVRAEALHRDRQRVGELLGGGRAAVDGAEGVGGLEHLPLEPAHRARGPVLGAHLVDDRPVDPRPQELLERGAAVGVVAVQRRDHGDQPARDVVVGLLVRRHLRQLAEDDVLDHRRVRHDQAVALPGLAGGLVALPQPEGLRGRRASARGDARLLQGDGHLPRVPARTVRYTMNVAVRT